MLIFVTQSSIQMRKFKLLRNPCSLTQNQHVWLDINALLEIKLNIEQKFLIISYLHVSFLELKSLHKYTKSQI